MRNNNIERFIIGLVVLAALIFLVLWQVTASACASQAEESCTPTLPAPTYQYLPNITDTPVVSPNAPTVTIVPITNTYAPTIEPTPTAGSSAIVAMPSFAPDTSLRK